MSSDLSDLDRERVVALKSNWEVNELEGDEATGGVFVLALTDALIVFIRLVSFMFMFALVACRLVVLLFLPWIFNAVYSLYDEANEPLFFKLLIFKLPSKQNKN